jgi:CRISPR system Cascade subunit CasC
MKKQNLYIDFHVIQTVPPSCVNRDDTGSPKSAVYGGVRRARVSSQSWKHAMRATFSKHFSEEELGVRTKKIVDMVAGEIQALIEGMSKEEATTQAEKVINLAGVTTKNSEAKALFFLSTRQARNLAALSLEDGATKRDAQAALNKGQGVDIALFGRMVADDPSLNGDASAQVAHSISTHRVENEYDYYTAIDDRSPADSAGAGMIGTVEFNSATLYRYANIAVHELSKQLAGDGDALSKAVVEFTRAFILSMPKGKQNSFANATVPDAVMVTLRTDQPVNLVGAFEEPVKAGKDAGGFVKTSCERLQKHAERVYADFMGEPEAVFSVGGLLTGEHLNLPALLDRIALELGSRFDEEGNT